MTQQLNLQLSLGRILSIRKNLKLPRYQLGSLNTSFLADIFQEVNKVAFIARYSKRYHVLCIAYPRYFKSARHQRFLHFNVLNDQQIVIYKTDDLLDLFEFLKC